MFTVIAFDIANDRARYRAVRILRRYAVRVQKSVFEAPALAPNHLHQLRCDLEEVIDLRVDKIRYYLLCGTCVSRVEMSGRGNVTVAEDYRVV